jgi:hypothetical protein
LAWAASSALQYILEPREIRNFVDGQPLFDRPVTEAYARTVSQQLQEKLYRKSVMLRFERSHSWAVISRPTANREL